MITRRDLLAVPFAFVATQPGHKTVTFARPVPWRIGAPLRIIAVGPVSESPIQLEPPLARLTQEWQAEDTRIANEVRRRYVECLRYALSCTGEERRVCLRFGLIEELREILGLEPFGEAAV
jgi:hypothetical protein